MTPEKRKFEKPKVADVRIHCRRVEATYTPEEHKDCPYCFGRVADVQTGDYKKFCDFKPGEDPICFGFPDDTSRNQQG
jgi:hypothetical protein